MADCQFCGITVKLGTTQHGVVSLGGLKTHEKYCGENPNKSTHPLKGRPSKWLDTIPNSRVFVENSPHARNVARRRVLKQKLVEYKCACCGIEPVWNGKPMPLVLGHINGVGNDHRLENLRFVCSNCDSQLPTYKSKNKK